MTPALLQLQRERFERWVSDPPIERSTERYPQNPQVSAWPNQYCDLAVQLAWEAWCKAIEQELDSELIDALMLVGKSTPEVVAP